MAFTEQLHPRGLGSQGGQFVASQGGQTTKTSHISYNGKGATGTGYGTKGGDANVKALQKELNRMGITDSAGKSLKVDGKFGPKTTASVRRLQKRLGLAADGKVSTDLLAKLKKMQPSAHDKHGMHTRTKAGKAEAHKTHTAHEAHVAHEKRVGKKIAAPAKKVPSAHQNHVAHQKVVAKKAVAHKAHTAHQAHSAHQKHVAHMKARGLARPAKKVTPAKAGYAK